MITLRPWRSGSALIVALGMAVTSIAPLTVSAPVAARTTPTTLAQLFPSSGVNRNLAIPAGTRLPVRYDEAEKIVVTPNETTPLTLTIARNIRSTSGTLLIPAGTQVKGNLRPARGGTQFIAQDMVLTDGTTLPINARSQVISRSETVRQTSSSSILKGTAAGAAAAAAISGLAGNRRITVGKVLLGAGAGAAGGWLLGKKTVDVISINPNTDLDLTLTSTLALRNENY